jgi:uncharacterized sulfatase
MKDSLQKVVAAFVAVLICGAIAQCGTAADAAPVRPNIVFVLIDDLGWGDFSCFGNDEVQTPNIDRLAAEGLRFEQFYVNSPICSPSRAAFSTGQYPARWRITSFLNNRKSNEERGMAQWLDPKAPMLARILQQAGYATGHFGKWHLGGQRDVGDAPVISEYGFDESLTNFEGLGPRVLPLLDAYDGTPAKNYSLGSETLEPGPIHWEKRDKVTASFVKATIDFIDKAQAKKQPFYVNVWPDDVHSPFFPPESHRDEKSNRERYLSVLANMDEQLGPLFERISGDAELRENTLVIVCSDNGPEHGAGSAGRLRGSKGTLYEGGIRSPFIVWAPGLIAADDSSATNSSSCFSAVDLLPTLCEIANVELPDGVDFDGEPLADVLLGRSDESRTDPLYFRRPPDRPNHATEGDLPDLAVRQGKWKLLCDYDGANPQLYDIEADPSETSNVARRHRKLVKRLTQELIDWHHSMPADNGPTFARKARPGSPKGYSAKFAN